MALPRLKRQGDDNGEQDEQPRKRQRTRQDNSSRIRLKLKAVDVSICRTALQLIPFLLAHNSLSREELLDLLPDLISLANDKNPVTASWALIASAR
jgi:ataxia telangiectasia mutated family protein